MRHEQENVGYRLVRLQELIFDELRSLLQDDVGDPSLQGASITAVVLSPDYRHARVHFALRQNGLGSEGVREAERAFVRATPFLRARVGDAIDLKRVPDLRFIFDAVAPQSE